MEYCASAGSISQLSPSSHPQATDQLGAMISCPPGYLVSEHPNSSESHLPYKVSWKNFESMAVAFGRGIHWGWGWGIPQHLPALTQSDLIGASLSLKATSR